MEMLAHDIPLILLCVLVCVFIAMLVRGRSRLVSPTFWGAMVGLLSVGPSAVFWSKSFTSAGQGSVGGAFGLMLWPWIALAGGVLGFTVGDLAGWLGVTIWGRNSARKK